jgi:hypothetical protein
MRVFAGLVAGLVAAVAAMIAVGFVGNLFVPMADAAAAGQREALTVALARAALGTQLIVLIAWFGAAFVGAACARFVSRVAWPGWTIAALLALLLAGTFLSPLPAWMQVCAVLGPIAGGALAQLLVPTRSREPDGSPASA